MEDQQGMMICSFDIRGGSAGLYREKGIIIGLGERLDVQFVLNELSGSSFLRIVDDGGWRGSSSAVTHTLKASRRHSLRSIRGIVK